MNSVKSWNPWEREILEGLEGRPWNEILETKSGNLDIWTNPDTYSVKILRSGHRAPPRMTQEGRLALVHYQITWRSLRTNSYPFEVCKWSSHFTTTLVSGNFLNLFGRLSPCWILIFKISKSQSVTTYVCAFLHTYVRERCLGSYFYIYILAESALRASPARYGSPGNCNIPYTALLTWTRISKNRPKFW